jgi:hypothetical protein
MNERQVLFVAGWHDEARIRERLAVEGLGHRRLAGLRIVPDDGRAPPRVWPMVLVWVPDERDGVLVILLFQPSRRPHGRRRWKLQRAEALRLWAWSGGEGEPEFLEIAIRP